MAINIILADDHKIVRDGLKSVIRCLAQDIDIIGEASDGAAVIALAQKTPADVYVLDISMPHLNGIETCRKLKKLHPYSKVVMLSMHNEMRFIEEALRAGANGYLLKDNSTDELITAIRKVREGKFFLSPAISGFVVKGFLGKTRPEETPEKHRRLTSREKQILQLITEGLMNKEIAAKLKISMNTVHVHRNKIMDKLDIHRQAELIRFAIKEGITAL
jgi:DNA-binding NarL/FixJ family response regulator